MPAAAAASLLFMFGHIELAIVDLLTEGKSVNQKLKESCVTLFRAALLPRPLHSPRPRSPLSKRLRTVMMWAVFCAQAQFAQRAGSKTRLEARFENTKNHPHPNFSKMAN